MTQSEWGNNIPRDLAAMMKAEPATNAINAWCTGAPTVPKLPASGIWRDNRSWQGWHAEAASHATTMTTRGRHAKIASLTFGVMSAIVSNLEGRAGATEWLAMPDQMLEMGSHCHRATVGMTMLRPLEQCFLCSQTVVQL